MLISVKRKANRQGAFFGPDSERSAHFEAVQGFIESTPNKQLYAFFFFDYTAGQMEYDLGNGPDYPRVSLAALLNPNNGFDPGGGNQLTIESSLRYQPTTAFQTQLNYNKRRLVRHDTRLVVGWTPNPGTALYIGYNDDVSYNGYNQFTGQFEPGLRGNGRTFFIKASYLFRRSF